MKIALVVLLGLMGIVIAGAFVAGPQLRSGLASLTPKPQGTRVRTETIKRATLTETVKAPGKIEPRTKVDVSAEVAARIEELPFREGQQVRKGDMIVKLDDRDIQAELAAAQARSEGEAYRLQSEQASLVGLLSTLAYSRKELERKQNLYNTGDLAHRDLDEALKQVDELQAQVESTKFSISVIESSMAAAKADIDRTKQSLAKTIIKAPMDGIITALHAEVGEVVLMGTMNNPGTVIMTVADLSRMILKAEVSESDIAKVSVGQAARVHINAYREQTFSGTVTHIALQRTEPGMSDNGSMSTTGYFEAEIEIELGGKSILSGLMANVDIEVAAHEGLLVESQAIMDRSVEEMADDIKRDNPLVDHAKKTVTALYRIVDGKAICTPVKRGPSDDTHSVVLDGVKEGEIAIIGPFKALEKLKHEELVMDEATAPKDGKAPESEPEPESDEGPDVRVRVR